MITEDWRPIKEVERLSAGLPMTSNFWKAEHNGGIDNDAHYIHTQLSRLNLAQRSRAATYYDSLYKGLDSRRECNNRLREYCDKCEAANKGQTFSPSRVA